MTDKNSKNTIDLKVAFWTIACALVAWSVWLSIEIYTHGKQIASMETQQKTLVDSLAEQKTKNEELTNSLAVVSTDTAVAKELLKLLSSRFQIDSYRVEERVKTQKEIEMASTSPNLTKKP